jgi:LPS export ABC transporter protein LptC/lipopolysaccharide transport protein LptA
MSWQKRARLGVAIFAVIFAVGVYYAMGERQKAAPLQPIERKDPASTAEVLSGVLNRLSGSDEEFLVSFEDQFSYPDGSQKLLGIRLATKNRNGRDFTITAAEALVGANEATYDLQQNIVLKASDGFELHTDLATFSTSDEIVRAPGSVTFTRGKMAGSGVGMTYEERTQILTLASGSQVALYDEAGTATTSFQSGSSRLDRAANVLTLEGSVHVVRDGQEFDAESGEAQLSEEEEFVRYVKLRGEARVTGGGAVDAMSAREIDLDYTDDGKVLERVILVGDAAVALKGNVEGAPAREVHGGRLDLAFAADGAVTRVVGQDGVRLVLPPDDDTPPRTITARTLDGSGEAGKGLTRIEFKEAVEFREGANASLREAKSQALRLGLDANAVSDATFVGRVTFSDGGLKASAEEARYAPSKGTLALSGGTPEVADEQVVIRGTTIAVAFDTRHMVAAGSTRTTYNTAPAKGRNAQSPPTRMPGLLKANESVTVTAASLDYTGSKNAAVYNGTVELRQGTGTYIRADRVTLDQQSGDLIASGKARAIIVNDADETRGSADEIRYTDRTREIAYVTPAPEKASLISAQGDLRASRIRITLQQEGSGVARIGAEPDISIQMGQRTITGARLEYTAAKDPKSKNTGSYVVHGTARIPVVVVERTGATCKRSSDAMKLTIEEGTENMTWDGLKRTRPSFDGMAACPAAAPPPPGPATTPPAPPR